MISRQRVRVVHIYHPTPMLSYAALSDPAMLRTRETHLYEVVLEQVFRRSFMSLREDARAAGCSDLDLLRMGRRLYEDLVRLARGEIGAIQVPNRWPQPDEYR